MSLLDTINTMRLVKAGPTLRQRVERRIAAVHHKAVVNRLRRFREELERDMKPEPWTLLEAPMLTMLADVADALGLDEGEKAKVLGAEGVLAFVEMLEIGIRSTPAPWLPMNQRQAVAMRHVREHGAISLGIYRQICPHWSDETLRRDLADLARRGLLVKNGAKRGTRYTLPH